MGTHGKGGTGRGEEGEGRGGEKKGRGGEGRVPSASYAPVQCRSMQHGHSCDVQWTTLCTKSQLPVLMNVVNNVHCFGFIRRTCHTVVQGKSPHSF